MFPRRHQYSTYGAHPNSYGAHPNSYGAHTQSYGANPHSYEVHPQDTRLLHQQLEQEMQNMRSDMERKMQLLHNDLNLPGRTPPSRHLTSPPHLYQPNSGQNRTENFELSMDVGDFAPEELTVKTEGRKLSVMGKRDHRRETEDGQLVEETQEWHQEAEIPEDVNPEHVQCSLSHDGQLYLQAPRLALPTTDNRLIPVMTAPRLQRRFTSPFPRYR